MNGRNAVLASLLAGAVLMGMSSTGKATTLRTFETAIKDSTGTRLAENYEAYVPTTKVDDVYVGIFGAFGAGSSLLAAIFNIDLAADADPYANYSFSFENNSTEDLGAYMAYRMETGAFGGPSWQASENLDITLTDRNGDGAYLIPVVTTMGGNSFQDSYRYVRFPDGSSTFGFSFFNGQGTSMLTAAANSSEMFNFSSGPSTFADYPSGDLWNSMGFQVDFLLSPGDTVDFNGGIQVAAVPLPGTIWLLGSGMLALLGLRREN